MLIQLLKHVECDQMKVTFHSAYREHHNHSTETLNLKAADDLFIETDDRKISLLVLLDLSTAFDTINHQIVIERFRSTCAIVGTAVD